MTEETKTIKNMRKVNLSEGEKESKGERRKHNVR